MDCIFKPRIETPSSCPICGQLSSPPRVPCKACGRSLQAKAYNSPIILVMALDTDDLTKYAPMPNLLPTQTRVFQQSYLDLWEYYLGVARIVYAEPGELMDSVGSRGLYWMGRDVAERWRLAGGVN